MSQAPILLYHWFRADGGVSHSRSPQLEIALGLFREQMRFLKAKGYQTVSLREVFSRKENASQPKKPIVLTFDDGTLDFWHNARPVLAECGFTATIFVVTGRVGGRSDWDQHLSEPTRPLMSWPQIKELHQAGFEIGSHTHTHRSLVDLSTEEVRFELSKSRSIIADRLGEAPQWMAYPRGLYNSDHMQLVREAGYQGACAVILRWRDLLNSGCYEAKRMAIKGSESMLRFKLRIILSCTVCPVGK